MRTFFKICILFSCIIGRVYGQENFPVNGVEDNRPDFHSFINAHIVIDHEQELSNGMLIIKDGLIVEVGSDLDIPKGSIIHDMKGKYIYPGFIDIYTNYGLDKVKSQPSGSHRTPGGMQYESERVGAYAWNEAIKSDYDAVSDFDFDSDMAKKLRSAGFTSVLTFRPDGIARGTSALVNLSELPAQELIIMDRAAAHFSFDKGTSQQVYPTSIMGAAALLRQTFLDAEWYKSPLNKKQYNKSLESILDVSGLPQIFEPGDKQKLMVADRIGDEFDIQYVFKGQGDEYQLVEEVAYTEAIIIVPVDFPEAYDVEDPIDALNLSLSDMKHWELAPRNPGILVNHGVKIALTSYGLDDPDSFMEMVQKAVKNGLGEKDALRSLTSIPAQIVHASDKIGSLRKNMYANFLVTSGSPFQEKSKILSNWIQGIEYPMEDVELVDIRGSYTLSLRDTAYQLEISGELYDPVYKILSTDSTSIKVSASREKERLLMRFKPSRRTNEEILLTGWLSNKDFIGEGTSTEGSWFDWFAKFDGIMESEEKDEKTDQKSLEADSTNIGDIIYPFNAYGRPQKPEEQRMIFKNATVWTNEDEGILLNADVLIGNGKILAVGRNINDTQAKTIDATGLHLTSGIIDEHSHIALSGVNESSEAITAEVRMLDALDAESIQIYRQLAGGVTASQLLHGSANPIGGQSVMIKLRWGEGPEQLIIKDADPFIKFALGENVKQSNWGFSNTRFPQTRMGVEQIFEDGFTRAQEYDKAWKSYNKLSSKQKTLATRPRKDLELEALAEILNEERFITCHSYVQSEINMMMKLADRFDFRVNTFTHILEGYKVADKMVEHGAAGSSFSDWWAYKYEVREAIPYNAALMYHVGVNVAINSDDAEMARRLNQEAAKAVKYGGVSEEEAWKMVTLNPAKMLHLDHRMGSIRKGKDADLVLWTDNPLSIYAKVVKNVVDGKVYYDSQENDLLKLWIQKERNRLMAKMLHEKESGAKIQKPVKKTYRNFHCDDIAAYSY